MLCVRYVAACMGFMAGHNHGLLVSESGGHFSKIPSQSVDFCSNWLLVPTDWWGYMKCVHNCLYLSTLGRVRH